MPAEDREKPPLSPGPSARQLFNLIVARAPETAVPGVRRSVRFADGDEVMEMLERRAEAGRDDVPLVAELARCGWLGARAGRAVVMP